MISSNRKKSSFPPIVGGSSLLVIFAVLCLIIFALLALSTVQADQRLLTGSLSAITDYYAADMKAEQIFAQLRETESALHTDAAAQLPEGVRKEGSVFSYSCSISDTQELLVRVRLIDRDWEILQWQAVSTVTYEP